MEIPAATAWKTPHQLAITQNLRDAVCDQRADRSAGRSRAELGRGAGDEDLLGRSTVLEILHQEGAAVITAERQRARGILDEVPEDQWAVLGVPTEDALVGLNDDVPGCDDPEEADVACDSDPAGCDDPEEADAACERIPAEWIAVGFPGGALAWPVAADEPRAVDPGWVIVQPDEVKTKARLLQLECNFFV
jgi:hypothetical protein